MSYPSKSSVGGNHATKDTEQALTHHDQVYNSASDALDAYISAFEKRANLYSRRPSDLLAPKPKFYFMDSLERSLLGSPGKSPGQKVDDLVAWVNHTYDQDINCRVEPFGSPSHDSRPTAQESRHMQSRMHHAHYHSPTHKNEVDEMSSLPSPSSSVVDLESNAGTVETDILLSSYRGEKPEDAYSRSNIYSPMKSKSPVSHRTSNKSSKHSSGNFEYPSWVSSLGKEYPSWVEDLESTAISKPPSKSLQQRFTTTTKSSSSSRHHVSEGSLKGRQELKVSDLRITTPPSAPRTVKSQHHSWGKSERELPRDWTDTASMDTDILVSQPIYGFKPVNMGGYLHKTLYKDEKVNRLKKESTKKLRMRERTHISPRSKSLEATPDYKTRPPSPRAYQSVPPKSSMRPETSVSPSTYRDYYPLRSGDLRTSSERLELRPTQFSMLVRSPGFQSTEIHRREERTSPKTAPYIPTSSMVRQAALKSHTEESLRHARQSEYREARPHRKGISTSHASHAKHSVTRSRKSKEMKEFDPVSSDTDREMRKSPTGIKMEKMYREPTTMHPWKTMIQSRNSKSVAFRDDHSPGTPVYESTPAVRNGGVDSRKYVTSNGISHDPVRGGVTQPEEYATKRVTHFPKKSPGLKSAPPNPVYSSTQRAPASYHKPPLAPRSSQKAGGHRRSRTMPDLRTMESTRSHRHSKPRRSYDDDMLSNVTSDTEVLVTQPSMPIVDASPSLTTVSDSSDTVAGSDTESDRETYRRSTEQVDVIPANKDETTLDSTLGGGGEKFSPTSVFASSSPYAAVREELPKRYHLWKLDDDTTAPDSFIKKKHVSSGKSTIISSFLEDCLNVDDDSYDYNRNKVQSSSFPDSTRLSGREGAPGPVEALKNMLFTMQDMAHHEDLSPVKEGTRRYKQSHRVPTIVSHEDEIDSVKDDQSEASSQLFHGEESLQRAYRHLQRLKRLVGNDEDQSSIASD